MVSSFAAAGASVAQTRDRQLSVTTGAYPAHRTDPRLCHAHTIFGKIQQDGLATLDKIAKGGVAGGGADGPPATEVTIKSVRVD